MIPTRLTLRNFMCYRDEVTLDLRSVRIACISGDNGAGKSSLLDAITWALWGKARVAAERDLMTLGTTEMGVDYQFLLGDQEYRVLRRRRRRGLSADVAQLEVQLRHSTPDGDGPWRPISGDTLSQTQKGLTAAIGMEYDTFINSAFILQGRADEFTTKGATDRKQVLADILGLGRYDELEERARTLRREREAGRREAEREVERVAVEVAARPAHEAELATVSARLLALLDETERLGGQLDALKARRTALEERSERARETEARRDEHTREADRLRERVAAARARVAGLAATIADAGAIRAGASELLAAEARDRDLNAALTELSDLQRRHREVEKVIDTARSRLLQEQHALDHQLTDLRERGGRLPAIEARHAALSARLATLREQEERRAVLVECRESAVGERERWKAENDGLMREMKRLKGLQEQVDGAGAACPVCRRPLGEDERRRIHDEYQRDGKTLADEHRANKLRIAALERDVAEYERAQGEVEVALRGGRALTTEFGRLERERDEAREAGAALVARGRDRELIAARLEAGDFAREAGAELVDLDAALAALAYDRDAHARVRERIAELRPFDRRLRELEGAEGAIEEWRERLAEDDAALQRREADREVEAARAVELRAGTAELPALIARTEEMALDLAVRERERDEAQGRRGALEAELRRLAEREEEGRQLREERRRLAEEEGAYKELAEAFGKRGIQAMIIEAAVPELQDEANRILANMPGNGMRVEFRTQRETRKGDTVEALDIVIGDEAGQRDYALYSGGEAFRINFAIRVALSKLLARRAGAKLQTLVIDEGFGTQDARGRDSLVEAIRSIEDDFATILVITHVNELKEAFPTQLLVEKGPTGSQITIN